MSLWVCVRVCVYVGHAVSDNLYVYKKTLSSSFSPSSFLVDYLLSAPLTWLLLLLYFLFFHFLSLKLPWCRLILFQLFWSKYFNLLYCRNVRVGRVDQDGPEWTRMDHHGPRWTRVNQDGPSWSMVDQSGPGWTIVVHGGPEWMDGSFSFVKDAQKGCIELLTIWESFSFMSFSPIGPRCHS